MNDYLIIGGPMHGNVTANTIVVNGATYAPRAVSVIEPVGDMVSFSPLQAKIKTIEVPFHIIETIVPIIADIRLHSRDIASNNKELLIEWSHEFAEPRTTRLAIHAERLLAADDIKSGVTKFLLDASNRVNRRVDFAPTWFTLPLIQEATWPGTLQFGVVKSVIACLVTWWVFDDADLHRCALELDRTSHAALSDCSLGGVTIQEVVGLVGVFCDRLEDLGHERLVAAIRGGLTPRKSSWW